LRLRAEVDEDDLRLVHVNDPLPALRLDLQGQVATQATVDAQVGGADLSYCALAQPPSVGGSTDSSSGSRTALFSRSRSTRSYSVSSGASCPAQVIDSRCLTGLACARCSSERERDSEGKPGSALFSSPCRSASKP
jgi:hypothetical protein